MTFIYHTFFYQPLYNGLIFLLALFPAWFDIGMAIVIFTVLIRFILFPLSKASIRTQIRMKELEPKLKEVKERYKNDTQAQSVETMKLYKEYKVNPLASIAFLIIQIPIIIDLYRLFLTGGLPNIQLDLLYPFVHAPSHAVLMQFFGIDVTQRSIVMALLAGISQYFQVKLSVPQIPVADPSKPKSPSFKNDLAKTMSLQMRYMLPIMVAFISYGINAAIALYWTTSNVFAICQEYFVRRRLVDEHERLKKALIIK